MSRSVKTPFSVLHTPNLANLKTYGTSVEREPVSKTSNVRRALPSSKSRSNQENRQPSSKKSSLVTPKSPPRVQKTYSENRNSSKESGTLTVSKSKSLDLKTKVRSGVKEIYHVSQTGAVSPEITSCVAYEDSPEQCQANCTVSVQEYTTVNECEYTTETLFSTQEHVTEIHTTKINQWKALEEACQIESQNHVEIPPFDYDLCKKQKQNHEQSVAALSPRRETYLVKKHLAQQRRIWKNRIASPPVRATIPEMITVAQTCTSSFVSTTDDVAKTSSAASGVFIPSPNFMTSSPIDNPAFRNKTFQSDKSSESSSSSMSSYDNRSILSSSSAKESLRERPAVMLEQPAKTEVSPKSDDGMSTDSLNSKNSSASSVEALLTGKVDPATEKAIKSSTAMIYDFRHATPSVPEKPNPQQVRRSTHVVKEPKIVCGQGKLRQKQLFSTGVDSTSSHDVSYIRPIDESKEFPAPKKTQVKTSAARNSVSSRVRAAQKAVRMTNREQLSQSVHEQVPRSQKLETSEKSKTILTRSARSTVRTVKKTELIKSKSKSYLSPKKCGVAQSRLVLGKREKTVIPKHPMPFASKNIYYDDRWMQKQEWSFTHWFNYILTPVEDYKLRNCPRVDAGSLVFNCKKDYHLAPSKEVLSFEAYAARRRLNRLRKLACRMFQSADIVKVVRKVEVEIDSQRLVVRKDRPIHADIGLKQNILNWILSYNPLWLRIGLEMVFGEVLLIESNTDIFGLSRFIITRLVGNPDIAYQFAHPTVPHLYREGYQASLAKHTLKKFLILVYFLDYAKRHRLIEHDPCLFCKDSEIKASRDFLLNVSRDFLSGEGDVTRHLAYLGYVVSYVQTPLDEFDYAVTNLATDLRDGVRLTRVVEILTGKWGLTKVLRAPAISRLQKIHNLEKVLKALMEHGMSLDLEKGKICAKDIVDGHREKTLTLLWRIVTGFQVDILLDIKELEDEIACLNRTLKRKIAIWKSAGVKSIFELSKRRSSVDLNKFENSKHRLLFTWCQAVCSHYGLKIENFTVSFSDGRVLCYLIHHYYPGLLPMSEIRQQTTVTYINECESQQQDSDNSFDGMASTLHCSPRTGKPKIYQELLANEAENFKLIAVKVSQIGGVPTMLRHSDMSNTIPDEKVVITYVMYLAIRLLEIRHESRAAIIIQLAWRKYQLRKKHRLLKLKPKCHTPVSNKMTRHHPQTPDQSSPLRKQEVISIKNAIIPIADNSDDSQLGHSINDYSPIRPVDVEPLPVSSKKGNVLDTILEGSLVEGCINYSHDAQKLTQPFLVDAKDDFSLLHHKLENIEADNETSMGQKLNTTMDLSDGMIGDVKRLSNSKQNSFQAGDVSLDRLCGNGSGKRDSNNLTDSKRGSSQLNKTIDLKDGSLLSKSDLPLADLPQADVDLRNETFDEAYNKKSSLQTDLPKTGNTKIGINKTFDGEASVQKLRSQPTRPVVDRKQKHNETFEKICPQMSAVDSTQRKRVNPNETFNNETCPPHGSELLNSSVNKVEGDDAKRNTTFDSELSRPELRNILPSIDTSVIQENEVHAVRSQNCNLSNLDEVDVNGTFEGEIQESNPEMDEVGSKKNKRATIESVYRENAQGNGSVQGEHFRDQQAVLSDKMDEVGSDQNHRKSTESVCEKNVQGKESSNGVDDESHALQEERFRDQRLISCGETGEVESDQNRQQTAKSVSGDNSYGNESSYRNDGEYCTQKEEHFRENQIISNAEMGHIESKQNQQPADDSGSDSEEEVFENESLYDTDSEYYVLKEERYREKEMVVNADEGELKSDQNQWQSAESVSEENIRENQSLYDAEGEYRSLKQEYFHGKPRMSSAGTAESESESNQNQQRTSGSVYEENTEENESLDESGGEYPVLEEQYFRNKRKVSKTEMGEGGSDPYQQETAGSASGDNFYGNAPVSDIEGEYRSLKEEYFYGKQTVSNKELAEFESDLNQQRSTESVSDETVPEKDSLHDTDEEYRTLKAEHFNDKQVISDDECLASGCEETTDRPVLNQTIEFDDRSQSGFSGEPSLNTLFNHSQQNVGHGERRQSESNEQILDSHEEDGTEYKSEAEEECLSDDEEDLFNDSCVCQVQDESVSFSRLNKTMETDKSYDGATPGKLQKSGATPVRLDKTGATPARMDKTGATPSRLDKTGATPARMDKTGATPSMFEISGATPSMLDKTGATPSRLDKTGATPSRLVKTGATPARMDKTGATPSMFEISGATPSMFEISGATPSMLDKTGATPSRLDKTGATPSRLDKTGATPSRLQKSGTTQTSLQNSDVDSHVGTILDIQNGLAGSDDEDKYDGVSSSDRQLQQSVVDEDEEEEWIEEEFTLKMSRARNRSKEMIVDRESLEPSDKQKDFLENESALTIQNTFRTYVARKNFLNLRKSAITIQRWYRCSQEMRKARENYRSLKAASTVIQATVRAYQERKRFLQKKKCILSLQQRRRALVATRSARSEYLAKTAATKAIQRWYRAVTEMRKVKSEYERTRNAAIKIQSLVRRKKHRREFLQKKQAAISIQKWYQSTRKMQEAREKYASVRKATIQLQALFRARKQRKRFMLERESALQIQKAFRMFSARKRYLDCKNSTITIQQWYRSARKMKEDRQNYQDMKAATLVIQSAVRSHLARKTFIKQKQCLVSLQRRRRGLVLMRRTRTEYLAKRAAIKIIQRWYRAVTEMRKAKDDFENTRKAVIKIQSIARQRSKYREFLAKKNAVLRIQEWFRAIHLMKEERRRYVCLKNAAITIQAAFRGSRQRRAYLLQRESALTIQSTFRKFQARKRYLCYRNSAVTIQCWYRSVMAMREARRNFESVQGAVLLIQSTVKGYQERKRFLRKKNCVISLQQRRRALVAMRMARTEYLAKRAASKIIQRRYRAAKEMQKVRCDFEKTRNAAIKIQSLVRMKNQQTRFLKMKEASVSIQKWYRSIQRMQEARGSYLSLRKATVRIQALFRADKQRRRFLLKKESTLKIQEWYRGVCGMRQARNKFCRVRSSAVKIQQAYRAHCLMKAERSHYLLARSSVIKLQSQTRMLLARRQFLKQRRSAVVIQAWYRSMKQVNIYRAKKLAAVKLQSAFRGYVQRRIYLEKRRCAVSIQSVVRMWSARRRWLVIRCAAVLIQRNYRRRLAQRRLRETIVKRHEAATRIQLWFREKLISWRQKGLLKIDCDCCSASSLMKTKKYADIWLEKTRRRKLNAVYVLQKYCRKWLQRRNCAATKIQSIVRGWLWRRKLAQQNSAAVVIQTSLRGWHARMTLKKRKLAIIKIQSCLRRYIKRRREATHLLQRVVRGWLVRNRIKKWNHSATLIQSFWRGYKIRCSTRHPVTNLRKRLEDVTKKATEDKKLSNRFALGFDHLMKHKQLSEVLQSLVNLEVASRLSPVCCIQLAEGHAAPVIFTIIRGCNRSIPHMELIKYSIQILLNLAKYAPTIEAVYDSHPDAIDIILNVLMVFREKGLIFSKSCILLGIIALDLQEKGNLDELLLKPQFKEKILSLYKLTERKYKREESRVTTRARMCAIKDSAVFCEISMAAHLSKIGPDWLLGKKILREIKEPLQAMTYLLNCLNLQSDVQQNTHKKTRTK